MWEWVPYSVEQVHQRAFFPCGYEIGEFLLAFSITIHIRPFSRQCCRAFARVERIEFSRIKDQATKTTALPIIDPTVILHRFPAPTWNFAGWIENIELNQSHQAGIDLVDWKRLYPLGILLCGYRIWIKSWVPCHRLSLLYVSATAYSSRIHTTALLLRYSRVGLLLVWIHRRVLTCRISRRVLSLLSVISFYFLFRGWSRTYYPYCFVPHRVHDENELHQIILKLRAAEHLKLSAASHLSPHYVFSPRRNLVGLNVNNTVLNPHDIASAMIKFTTTLSMGGMWPLTKYKTR